MLVVFHEGVPGGATLSVLRLVPALKQRGWSFVFWVPAAGELFARLAADGHEVHGAPRHLSYSLRALRLPPGPRRRLLSLPGYFGGLRRLIAEIRPAVLHANSLHAFPEAALARALRVPTVLHVHEMVPQTRKGAIAARLAGMAAGELVAVSNACGRALGRGRRQPRIVYESAPIPDAPLRRPAGRRTVVGTVGVVSRRKGSDLFVQAARLVRERTTEIEFRMIGPLTDPLDADFAADVLADAELIGVEHTPRADVASALAGWDVFVLPSRRDPCPISLLEAMAAGLPVIGAAVDGIKEQITPSVGRLVPPESAAELADAILDLHRSPERRAAMGDAGRVRAIEHFSPEAQAQGVHEAYLAALREAR